MRRARFRANGGILGLNIGKNAATPIERATDDYLVGLDGVYPNAVLDVYDAMAGTRGALDSLKLAEGPKDVARAARLAAAKGGQTRAILKILGRGALLLAGGAFDLTIWLFGALFALFGLLSSIKATSERTTQAYLDFKKARRLRRQMAAAAQPAAG